LTEQKSFPCIKCGYRNPLPKNFAELTKQKCEMCGSNQVSEKMGFKLKTKAGRPPSNNVRVVLRMDKFVLKRITKNGRLKKQEAIHKIINEKLYWDDRHAEMERDLADSTLTNFEEAI